MKAKDCIFFQLSRASRAGTRFWHKKVAEFGVTSAQALALLFLLEEDQVSAKALGAKTAFDSATLTGLLDRLSTAGFIERRNHPRDRRAIRVCLTPSGTRVARRIERIIENENREFLAGLTEAEGQLLRSLLKKLN